MIKVAVIGRYFPTSTDPWAGHSAYQTLRVLADRSDVHVFCPVATYPRLLTPASRSGPPPDRNWAPPGVQATYVPYPVLPVVSRPFNGFMMARHLLPCVQRFQPDIILNYVVYPDGYAAVRIGRALHTPVVLTAIGSDLNRIGDRLSGVFTRSALRHADFVTTVSNDLAKTAKALGSDPSRTQAILNGCDTSIFHPQDRTLARQTLSIEPSAEVVLYIGRLDVDKGLVELIDAVAALRTRREAVRCYIVGNGPDGATLREAIARNGASEFIIIAPPCSGSDVALWMAASDLIALPSYREGCPNVIIEGLASGRPIVASRVGGIPELMDETCGRLVPAKDVPALVTAIDEVLDQPWSAQDISSRHNRSWFNVADNLYDVLARTLQTGAQPAQTYSG